MSAAPRIGLVAGEASGDALGAAFMAALRVRRPEAVFIGVGGPAMRSAGLRCLYDSERLAIHGFVDPLRRLPGLYRLLRMLERRLAAAHLDAFAGIDFNVFNLLLERRLRGSGLAVAHWVSPSVYAWRPGRVHAVAAAADCLFTLFPWEASCYRGTGLDVVYVGHPLADELAPAPDRSALRSKLPVCPAAAPWLAVLPGSRASELAAHAGLFLEAAAKLAGQVPGLVILVAVLDHAGAAWVKESAVRAGVAVHVVVGRSHEVLAAADVALVKAGTGTLEAMLLGTPMVVAYRLGRLTHALLSRLVYTPHVALPNLLAGRRLVPELIQDAATPVALADALASTLEQAPAQRLAFADLAGVVRCGAAGRAADAMLELIAKRCP